MNSPSSVQSVKPPRRGRDASLWRLGITGLLALVLAVFLVRLVMVITGATEIAVEEPLSPPSDSAPRPVDIAALQAGKLFGTRDADLTGSSASAVANSGENAQDNAGRSAADETVLDLRLEGVVVGNPPSAGFAVIAAGNRSGTYRIGDRLPAGNRVVLSGIHADHVVLENDGSLESLWLYDENPQKAGPPRTNTPVPEERRETAPAVAPLEVGSSYDPVALVNEYREKLLDNPASMDYLTLAQIVNISPAQENGNLVGYQIMPGEHLKEFVQLGFKMNDIVTRVNGIELNDITNLPRLFEVMATANRVTLSLLREGQPVELELALDE